MLTVSPIRTPRGKENLIKGQKGKKKVDESKGKII